MQREELMSLKETGKKGNFLMPLMVCKTVLPDYYTTFPMHWHDEMEIIYVDSGEFEENVDFKDYNVHQGDIVIISPCTLHSFRQHGEERTSFRSLIFDMKIVTGNNTDACAIKYFTPFTENECTLPVIISPEQPHYEELKSCLFSLLNVYFEKSGCYELSLKREFFDLFYILFTYFTKREEKSGAIKTGTTKSVKMVLDYISENYMYPITIEELAETVNLSKHYFMRFFKKYMGMTCIEYINEYRLNIAANLLLTTRMRITEVAVSIGITNLSYFNRIFKKKFNLTPKEYRFNADNS